MPLDDLYFSTMLSFIYLSKDICNEYRFRFKEVRDAILLRNLSRSLNFHLIGDNRSILNGYVSQEHFFNLLIIFSKVFLTPTLEKIRHQAQFYNLLCGPTE